MSGLNKEKTGPQEAVTHNRLYWEVLGQGGVARAPHPSKRLPRDSYKATRGQGNPPGQRWKSEPGLCVWVAAQQQRALKGDSSWVSFIVTDIVLSMIGRCSLQFMGYVG